VNLSEELRLILIRKYYALMKKLRIDSSALERPRPLTFDEFMLCAVSAGLQRLMQALGAYAFLGLQKKKRPYLHFIRPGITNLQQMMAKLEKLPGQTLKLENLRELVAKIKKKDNHW